ncbi:MAG: carboxy terminal-processing peptidase [Pseudomonadales bacterium]
MINLPPILRRACFIAFASYAALASATVPPQPETLEPLPVHANTTRNIVDALASRHYVSTSLDDELSSQILEHFIDDLDPGKSYLLMSDVAEFNQYQHSLDNMLRRGDVAPAFEIFNRYHVRVIHRLKNIVAMLEEGIDQFDFTIDETLPLDRKEAVWAATVEELDDLWRKRVKNAVLNLKLADKEPEKIQELLLKRYRNQLNRMGQTNSEDVYQLFMNSFTRTYDPHTQYFSPRTSENFDINMSLSLEGIGAVLQSEDEYTKVVSLVPAGPADKSGQLFPNDRIIAVGQGKEGEMIDVIGWRLDEVVQLIRGEKDTVVKLDVVPAATKDAAESRVVAITRNTVKLEEQSAKSEIIEVEQFGATHKIGIITIPTFYIDFKAYQQGDRDYKSTTRDVKRLLEQLKAQDVAGIVIDLRDNGGGSLQEARTLTGLFIDRGPTVQIRSKSNRVDILSDRDLRTVYEGPLAVLVNRLSASASEIFAGAIQDYKRGIIIGSQTFGKGTVQSLLPLNRGQLKLTQAKFYRISGESTQHRGIIPDISYPSNYDPDAIGESTLEGPLPWDKIQATAYRPKGSLDDLVPDLKNLHEDRVAVDPEFSYLRGAVEFQRQRASQKSISLNEAERIRAREEDEAFWLALENRRRAAQGLDAVASLDELKPEADPLIAANRTQATGITSSDQDRSAADDESDGAGSGNQGDGPDAIKGNEMAGYIELDEKRKSKDKSGDKKDSDLATANPRDEPDAYLVESGSILLDYISLSKRTAAKERDAEQI